MFHLFVYVPEADLEKVKAALFAAGAGQIGDYSHCAWQTQGTGQFMPLAGAQPHIGQVDRLEKLTEWKVEVVCPKERLQAVIEALKKAHPYEEPAYGAIPIVT